MKENIKLAMDLLAAQLTAPGRKAGEPVGVIMEVGASKNCCVFCFMHINGDPEGVGTLSFSVNRAGDCREFTQFDFTGTEKEFIDFIQKPGYDVENYYNRILDLSRRVNEKLD